MENNAVREAIEYLEKRKAAVTEAIARRTETDDEYTAGLVLWEPEPQGQPSKFSAETRKRMPVAHRHRWELLRKKAAIERELTPARPHRKAS